MLFSTPSEASRASIDDFCYAGGNNDTADVAKMVAEDVAAELAKVKWYVPYMDDHTYTIMELIAEVIESARLEIIAEEIESARLEIIAEELESAEEIESARLRLTHTPLKLERN